MAVEHPYLCVECMSDENTVLLDDYGPNLIIKCDKCVRVFGSPKP